MYPFIRMAKEIRKFRKADPLGLDGIHVSHHTCWPWDIDLWKELNNGRTLTLYDLGRIPLAQRAGLLGTLKREGWGLTIAGACVRYRRRIRVFETIEMRSRMVGWDARFLYLEQSMWRKDGECANHAVYRSAVTGPGGIVPPAQVLTAMGHEPHSPPLPAFVQKWIEAEDLRPWPPQC
ncbi:acyl-CoA thioesterase [Salipiger sp. 1_MG-2023]|uniref:acyl-CoA thioesterase n=1 Tax=Salipiger sp. 1_MG-2023 TaxID=3062665 RepID=UPI0026E30EAD|nr:acyl-CoA thioesterase [Salipiger sp. 1_MG-2023]MDO6584113.1 acyl-CoA thioesterase [Salipiger sp. 1_MG-2023]